MGSLTIRNLDGSVIELLKKQARANQRSLEGEVRHILMERADRRSRIMRFRERTQEIAATTTATPQTDSTALLRDDRDR